MTASNKAVGSIVPLNQTVGTTISNIVINGNFTGTTGPGSSDGNGGMNASVGAIGSNPFSGPYVAKMSYGGGAAAEVYNSLRFKANGSTGQTSTFTLTPNSSAMQYVVLNQPASNTGGSSPTNVPATFKNQTFISGTDTLSPMPVLNLVIGTPTTGGSTGGTTGTNKIISLATTATTGTAPNGYGNAALGTLNPVNGSPVSVNISGGAAVGFVNDTVGSPVYALKVLVNGATPTSSALVQICADINANDSGVGIAKPMSTSTWASLFPGYDILIPKTGVGDPAFQFDFSSTASDGTDSDTALGAVTVTSIAAVPEPATAAGVVLGAAGLLLGRRKKRLEVA
jgi:hypothetical protein